MTNARPLRIMVVDDEEFLRSLLEEVLRALGHDSLVLDGATAAIEAFRAEVARGAKFDAVILDLRLPGKMDGIALLGELRRLDPGVKALAISGRSEEQATVPPGFQGFLSKPFRITALSETLQAVVGSRISPP